MLILLNLSSSPYTKLDALTLDVLREQLIKIYRACELRNPTIYRRGEIAEAEPALPDWRMALERLFPPIWQ
jgi:hypothetical protein